MNKKLLSKFKIILISIIATLVVISGIYFGLTLYDRYKNPERVASILNIKEPPASLKVKQCESTGFTDVVITCIAEISPTEFPMLLTGYDFRANTGPGTCHNNYCSSTATEFPFIEDITYLARPKEFKYGGHVAVVTDSARKNVLIDIYIE
jgi:hypothetical protein